MNLLLSKTNIAFCFTGTLLLMCFADSNYANAKLSQSTNPLYVTIILRQSAPLHIDFAANHLSESSVRELISEQFYSTADIIQHNNDIHVVFCVSSATIFQFQHFYIERLFPFFDAQRCKFDYHAFKSVEQCKIDDLIDIILREQAYTSIIDDSILIKHASNLVFNDKRIDDLFPQIKQLLLNTKQLSISEQNLLKVFTILAKVNIRFLTNSTTLTNKLYVDFSKFGLLRDGKYFLRTDLTENDCKTAFEELTKIYFAYMSIFQEQRPQFEFITTPLFDPILPLLVSTENAHAQGSTIQSPQTEFSYPQDAEQHVKLGKKYSQKYFQRKITGILPYDGAVDESILQIFARNNIEYFLLPDSFAKRLNTQDFNSNKPCKFTENHDDTSKTLCNALFYHEFQFDTQQVESSVQVVISEILDRCVNSSDEIFVILLDDTALFAHSSNATDKNMFYQELFSQLSALQANGQIVTVTFQEYFSGNEARNVMPHAQDSSQIISKVDEQKLFAHDYQKYVGNRAKNLAWEYLFTTRQDLELAEIPQFFDEHDQPMPNSVKFFCNRAHLAMLYAQNADNFANISDFCSSDSQKTCPAIEFSEKLSAVYTFMTAAGRKEKVPSFPIMDFFGQNATKKFQRAQSQATVTAVFEHFVAKNDATDSIFFCYRDFLNCDSQFSCTNMHNDGKNFDNQSRDSIFTAQITMPENSFVEFFFANSSVYDKKSKLFSRFLRSDAHDAYIRLRY